MNDNRTHTATGKACPQALEFFAGIGLARLGLEESGFQVEWSNDIDSAKCEMYRNNFTDTPGHTLVEGDMSELSGDAPNRVKSLSCIKNIYGLGLLFFST